MKQFIQLIVQEKSKDEDYRAFLTCQDDRGTWELRGYGASALEASTDAMTKFEDPDDWDVYGYLQTENSSEETSEVELLCKALIDKTKNSVKAPSKEINSGTLKPCSFCGDVPELPSGDGTQYEIQCNDCGQSTSSVQICDLMTIEERTAEQFSEYRYDEKYVERAKQEAIKRWNKRA